MRKKMPLLLLYFAFNTVQFLDEKVAFAILYPLRNIQKEVKIGGDWFA